jgi:hypothetical protein
MPYPPITDLGYESGSVGMKAQNATIETLKDDGSSCRFTPVESLLIFV